MGELSPPHSLAATHTAVVSLELPFEVQGADLVRREPSGSFVSSAQGKPMLSFPLPGSFLWRFALRTFLALLLQGPPRRPRTANKWNAFRRPIIQSFTPPRARGGRTPLASSRASPLPGFRGAQPAAPARSPLDLVLAGLAP
jgi:hypothetical protein